MDKAVSDRIHFKNALQERYGLEITNDEYDALVRNIKRYGRGRAKPLPRVEMIGTLSNTRTAYYVWIQGQRVKVIYSKSTEALVTCLKDNMGLIVTLQG